MGSTRLTPGTRTGLFLPRFFSALLCAVCFALLWNQGEACTRVRVNSQTFGKIDFVLQDQVTGSDRPVFLEEGKSTDPLWLYHTMGAPAEDGVGRWFIGHDLGSSAGVAFVDSWAVVPQAIREVSGLAKWRTFSWGAWRDESEVEVVCLDEVDNTLFLCSNLNKGVCGFYFPAPRGEGEVPAFHSANGKKLYRLTDSKRWMVSEDDVGSSSGVAFTDCEDSANPSPDDIPLSCSKQGWHVVTDSGWQEEKTFVFVGGGSTAGPSVFSRLRASNPAPEKTDSEQLATLSNGVSLPFIGLGTGGLSREETKAIVRAAITEHDYRLIDTASAYNNEDLIGEVFREVDPSGSLRSQVMVSSKVWPTRLGFQPTLETIGEGLRKIQSGYFDVYLLHWPFCYDHIEWMDCPPTPSGTWQQSWRALERSYAEGTIRAIGVSNFDRPLLEQLFGLASTPPHLVQNWMDPLHVDQEVLSLCAHHNTMFQAYSLMREWVGRGTSGDRKTKQAIRRLATQNKSTISELLLRWALQFGSQRAGVSIGAVVRSKTKAHLGSNMAVVKKDPLPFETMKILSGLQSSQFRNEL